MKKNPQTIVLKKAVKEDKISKLSSALKSNLLRRKLKNKSSGKKEESQANLSRI